MNKRWIAFLLAAVLAICSAVPSFAALSLAEGEHILWIDRLAPDPEMPGKTVALYDWLVKESRKGADSALADPAKAAYWKDFDCRGYELAVLKNEEPVWFIPSPFQPEHRDTAREAIDLYMDESGITEYSQYIVDYARVVVQAFRQDHPEVFWLGEPYIHYQVTYRHRIWGAIHFSQRIVLCFSHRNGEKDIRLQKYRDPEIIREDIVRMNDAADAILAQLPEGSRWEQLFYLNRWLTTHNAFREGEWDDSSHNPLTALLGADAAEGSVCDSYAGAMKILCDRAGIPCVLVMGEARDSAQAEAYAHKWNAVQMEDGAWYAIDVTWNDPIVESGGLRKTEAESGVENERFFLVGTDTVVYGVRFSDSHTVTNQLTEKGFAFYGGPSLSTHAYAAEESG